MVLQKGPKEIFIIIDPFERCVRAPFFFASNIEIGLVDGVV